MEATAKSEPIQRQGKPVYLLDGAAVGGLGPDGEPAFSVEAILPVQWFAASYWSSPEKRLCFAVLVSGISDAMTGKVNTPRVGLWVTRKQNVGTTKADIQRMHEARQWIMEEDWKWPYSFVHICQALGFEHTSLRRKLEEMWQ